METEISIMRKLSHHKNILQLLDWNTAEGEAPLKHAWIQWPYGLTSAIV